MKLFRKILFVSNGISEEIAVLQQSLRLATDNKAGLDILITCPPFNHQINEYQNSYETFLLERMHQSLDTAKKDLKCQENIPVQIDVEWGNTPDIRVIQRVLRDSYDLVIKEVEHNEEARGFKALDMSLLRKCPCELFLHRSFDTTKTVHIAVAIDPDDKEIEGHDLAIKLLKLSHGLRMHYKAGLSIISCWDFALESYLRKSVLINMSAQELDGMILEERNSHYQLLNSLIHEADIKDPPKIHYLQGTPTDLIPSFVSEQKIDILVMGTVARTGISGFIIGNTAENILQKITCSLWAMKPQGFISPVKAY